MPVPQPSWSHRDMFFAETPVTKIIILLMVVGFLGSVVSAAVPAALAFIPGLFPNLLTGLATYPLAFGGAGAIINVIFSGLMFYWFGGSLERSWGARRFLLFLLAANAAAALLWAAGVWLFGGDRLMVAGPWLMVSAAIVAWAWLNPEQTILLWFVLPVKAKWVGLGTILLLYFLFPASYGFGDARLFILGFFALGGVAVAYVYARYQRDYGWIPRPQQSRRERPARRVLRHPSSTFSGALMRPWREWQRRRRIAHLQRTLLVEDSEDSGQARG